MKLTGFAVNRRRFLGRTSQGLFGVALASLLDPSLLQAEPPRGVLGTLPLPQKAKRVIWLTMAGGPSHLELFDRKPKLAELNGQPMPESITRGQQLAQLQGQKLFCLGPLFPYKKYGQSGIEICELLPHLGAAIDDICLVRSMTTEAINHDPAHMFMNTGSQIAGRPSMGAWVTYGLGSEAERLARLRGAGLDRQGAVATADRRAAVEQRVSPQPIPRGAVSIEGRSGPVFEHPGGSVARSAGGRRGGHQRAQSQPGRRRARPGDRHPDRSIRNGVSDADERPRADGLVRRRRPHHRPLRLRTGRWLVRLELPAGPAAGPARVRFIQLYHRDWDHHSLLREELPLRAREVDQASAALIADLKHLGLFGETLIVWTGEFGRTPMSQANKGPIGRDHHNKSMAMWLAGAGVRGGLAYGATDELGYAAVDKVCTVHDLHATMLHQLGIRHDAFSVKFQGLDAKLTGVEGRG